MSVMKSIAKHISNLKLGTTIFYRNIQEPHFSPLEKFTNPKPADYIRLKIKVILLN